MKKTPSKKKLWIIVSCIAAAVLALAAAVTIILVNSNADETGTSAESTKIFWNVNRLFYFGKGENGYTSREKSKDDGFYHILFSVDGRPTERRTKSLQVATKVDDNDAMGLVIDEKTRSITDIVPLEEICGGYLYRNIFVNSIDKDKFEITANSSKTFSGEEITLKLKSTTPLIDVSTQTIDPGMPVKFETLQIKDQITVIANKDNTINSVFITKRNSNIKVYWNLARQYDKTTGETKREPDADGVYHILMAMGGAQHEIVCKDKKIVNKIDATVACGLKFDDDGYVTAMVSAASCTGGKSVSSWWGVDAIQDGTYTATKYLTGASDTGKTGTFELSDDVEIYNVSVNVEKFQGEITDLKVTDTVHGYTDYTGKVVLLYVINRWKEGDIYWNPYRKWSKTTNSSTREREADGYYHVLLCATGTYHEFRVLSKEVIDKLDGVAVRALDLVLNGDIIVDCANASGLLYQSKASWYNVESFESANKVVTVKKTDSGTTHTTINLADNCKVYDVSEYYNDHIGEETTLRVGDLIQCFASYDQQVRYIFVISRAMSNSETAHKSSHKCEDCGASVNWQPWTSATSLPTTSGHYYLCGDVYSPQANVRANQNVVLCLNGYKVRATAKRIYATFEEGSSLTIHDCVGTGKMYSTYRNSLSGIQGGIIWVRYGSLKIFGTNNGSSTTTFTAPVKAIPGNGAVICSRKGTSVSINNAVISGGDTELSGGAIYIADGATLSMNNTTVTPGSAKSGKGDGVYVGINSKLNLKGKIVIKGASSNLYLHKNAFINFEEPLASGSQIKVSTETVSGKISSNYIEGAEKYFESDRAGLVVNATQSALYLSRNYNVTAHKTTHTCEDCGEDVTWTPWTASNLLPTSSGHYYLCGDITVPAQQNIMDNQDVVLCLNGYSIHGTGSRVYATFGENSTLAISDCTNSGKVYNTKSSGMEDVQGGLIWARYGKVSLYGGTYQATSAATSQGSLIYCRKDTVLNVINATLIGGKTKSSTGGGVIYLYEGSAANLKDVNITSGVSGNGLGNAIYAEKNTTLDISGKIAIQGGTNQVYLAKGAYINLSSTLSDGSAINVNTDNDLGRITENYTDNAENYMTSDSGNIIRIGDALYIDSAVVVPKHNDDAAHICEDCGESVTWQPWLKTDSLPTVSGHYYLCYDITCSQTNIGANEDVVICLNGKKVKCKGKRILALNNDNAKLAITDCTGEGKLHNTRTSDYAAGDTTQGGLIWVRKGTLNIYGGTYEAPGVSVPGNGAAICDDGKQTVTVKNATVIGGITDKAGGAIFSNGTLILENVTIKSGETQDNKGEAIYMSAGSSLKLKGKIDIQTAEETTNRVFLGNGAYITFEDALSEGSSIGVDSADTGGKVSTNYYDGVENYIVSEKAGYSVKKKSGAIYLEDDSAPATPGHNNDIPHKCEECDTEVEWEPWVEKTSLPTSSGHYYLAYDVNATSQQNISSGADVVLCLNGHSVTGTGSRVYVTGKNSKLTVTDCVGTGKISNKKTSGLESVQGSVIWVRYGTLNIFGGTYEAPATPTGQGSVICSSNNINAVVNIKNATVVGGETSNSKSGAAIYLGEKTTASLEEVTITAGKAQTGLGDAIYVASGSSLTLGGKISITGGENQVYLTANALIHLADNFADDSKLSVDTANTDGKLSDNYIEGAEKCITSDRKGYVVAKEDSVLYLVADTSHYDDHSCPECESEVEWTKWTDKTTLPTESGHYYLAYDVSASSQQNLKEGAEVVLCLNGHSVTGTGSRVYSTFNTNTKLTITDCVGTGKISNKKTSGLGSIQGSVIWVRYGTLNIFGGTYEAPATPTGQGSVICSSNNINAVVNIKNATIKGGETTNSKSGAAIYLGDKTTASLEDVTITAGKAQSGLGDAIYVASGSSLTLGGKISITDGENQVYLAANVLIHLADNFADDSKLSVDTATTDGKLSDNYIDGAEGCITSSKSGYTVNAKSGALYLEEAPKSANSGGKKLNVYSTKYNILKEAGLK